MKQILMYYGSETDQERCCICTGIRKFLRPVKGVNIIQLIHRYLSEILIKQEEKNDNN